MKLTILTILLVKTLSGVWLKAIRSTDIISACTFEYPEQQNCQFYNDRSGLDSADWIKYYDKTPTEDTGPEGAKGGKYYMYIETSTMKSEGNARLMSSLLTTDKQLCLSFYYHMFGDSIGELQVIISIVGSNQIIFRKSNSQGNYWHYKELYFLPANNFKIIFNGIDGSGYMGDIALDHILLFSGNCNNYTISIGEPPVAGAVTVEEALMIIIAVTIITLQQTLAQLIGAIAGILGSGVVTSAVFGICKCWGFARGNEDSDYCCMWHCKCKKIPYKNKDASEQQPKQKSGEFVSSGQKPKGGSTISDAKKQQPKKESGEFDPKQKRKTKKNRKNKIDVDLNIYIVKEKTYPEASMISSKRFH